MYGYYSTNFGQNPFNVMFGQIENSAGVFLLQTVFYNISDCIVADVINSAVF
jgi:hypothetical protein